ncbi:hypothetical protein [Aquimarina brevivitae]|uniref:Uncharacterized protein n=1 Tax=Aquimarina brevivitae TaxID=323412 RepID=A0A4Q7PGB7_9FLAO|nr:hypothetical protein [Aquimarina brevivitae]RZS99544.1 hypothetical protein EV197_0766 [Aquimarina brevivitae]
MKKTILIILTCVVIACSNDDNGPATAPVFEYANDITTSAFTMGNTTAPNVNWNGNRGSFSIENTLQGVSIDKNSGVISWDTSLPWGNYTLKIVATNMAGSYDASVEIHNTLNATFKGTYSPGISQEGNSSYEMELVFTEEGIITGYTQYIDSDGVQQGPFDFTGEWYGDNGSINFTGFLEFETSTNTNNYNATLEYIGDDVFLTGTYDLGLPIPTNNTFELKYEKSP